MRWAWGWQCICGEKGVIHCSGFIFLPFHIFLIINKLEHLESSKFNTSSSTAPEILSCIQVNEEQLVQSTRKGLSYLAGVVLFFFGVDVGCGRQAFLFSSVGYSFAQRAVFRVTQGRLRGMKSLGSMDMVRSGLTQWDAFLWMFLQVGSVGTMWLCHVSHFLMGRSCVLFLLPLNKLCALGKLLISLSHSSHIYVIRRIMETYRVVLKIKWDNIYKELLVNSEMLWSSSYYKHQALYHRFLGLSLMFIPNYEVGICILAPSYSLLYQKAL